MAADPLTVPWLQAWLEAQRAISEFSPQGSKSDDAVLQGMRRFMQFGDDYAGIAADCWSRLQTASPDLEGLRANLVERYQRLFMPAVLPSLAASSPLASSAALLRYQQASQRFSRQAATIGLDAFRRFLAAIGVDDPATPPIKSLRELYALWIECGEAAYSARAHSDEFAEAQAELLASLVEFRREQSGRR